MYLSEVLVKNIPVLKPESTAADALKVVTENQLTHCVIVEEKQIVGLLSEECLWSMEEDEPLTNAQKHFLKFALFADKQLLDTFKVFRMHDCNIIPVIDEKEIYQGVVLMEDVVYAFSKYTFTEEKGAILDIEVSFQNYSMEEICRIVESNNSKLYGAIVTKMDQAQVQVTLKITSDNISSVGETFERFGYAVKQKYYEDKKDELMEERFRQFQKYLNP